MPAQCLRISSIALAASLLRANERPLTHAGGLQPAPSISRSMAAAVLQITGALLSRTARRKRKGDVRIGNVPWTRQLIEARRFVLHRGHDRACHQVDRHRRRGAVGLVDPVSEAARPVGNGRCDGDGRAGGAGPLFSQRRRRRQFCRDLDRMFTVALWRTCGRQNQVFGTHPAATSFFALRNLARSVAK
jgi:hypothetical protein